MPQPHESADVWLYDRDLETVATADLLRAVELHRPPAEPRPPSTVREHLALGDWLTELGEREEGAAHLRHLINIGCLSASVVHQRRWLSRVVPEKLEDLLDQERIGYGHLRALATLPEPRNLEDYRELVAGIQAGKVKVRDILDRLPRPCAECGAVVLEDGRLKPGVVQLIVERHRDPEHPERDRDRQRQFFCHARCAHAFLGKQLAP